MKTSGLLVMYERTASLADRAARMYLHAERLVLPFRDGPEVAFSAPSGFDQLIE